MTGAGVAVEATLFCVATMLGIGATGTSALWLESCDVCRATCGVLLTGSLICCTLDLPARVYPDAIPITAMADRPVTKILAAVAGFFVVRRVGVDFVGMANSAVLSEMRADGGGGGRSGSFSISRHPHLRGLRHDVHHDVRPLHHGHHRLRDRVERGLAVEMEE